MSHPGTAVLNFQFNYVVPLVLLVLSFRCVVLLVLSAPCNLLALLLRLVGRNVCVFVVPSLSTRETITGDGEHVY
jgi:hypothetical protein